MKIVPIEKKYIGVSFGFYIHNVLIYKYKIESIKEDNYLLTNLDHLTPTTISIKGFEKSLLNNSIKIL